MPFWSWMGQNLQAIIYGVATALLYPVLAAEVIALVVVFFDVGWFTVESYRRWRARRNLDVVALAASGNADGEPVMRLLALLEFEPRCSARPQDSRRRQRPLPADGAQGPR